MSKGKEKRKNKIEKSMGECSEEKHKSLLSESRKEAEKRSMKGK